MRSARSSQQNTVPSTKRTFAEQIRTLSESETGPHADNLITNEDSFPRVCGDIARLVPPGGVYLGVGPDQNFTYVAHARPALAVIADFRRRNVLLHLMHKALFAISADRLGYLSHLLAREPRGLRPGDPPDAEALVKAFSGIPLDRARLEEAVIEVARVLEPLDVVADDEWPALATIQARLAGPGMPGRFLALPAYPTFGDLIRAPDREGQPAHMLAGEPLYRRVRELQAHDGVLPIVGDFAGDGALPRLARWLAEREQSLSLFYISDVEFFMLRSGRFPAYVENLTRLPWAEGALLVRTSTRPLEHPERVKGDMATTIARPVAPFLKVARAGRIAGVDDLFAS